MKNEKIKTMKNAIVKIAAVLEKKDRDLISPPQETNIFKILKVDQHEIRHGAFLEFLLDPERNRELADFFLQAWLAEIKKELILDDIHFDQIIDGEYEYINHIADANRYTEINFTNKGKSYRIDHALEVKLKGTCRVLVFEYKSNGVLQNDLDAYLANVEARYEGKKTKIFCFILEFGFKNHGKSKNKDWYFISRNTLIGAVNKTIDEARRKDMQATRLYLEQYMEVLQPEPKDFDFLKQYRKELWDLWNPEIARVDPEAKGFDKLLEKHVTSEKHRDLLNSFNYHMLFDWVVSESVMSCKGLSVRVNSGWVRLRPEGSPKNLYLSTYLCEEESGQLYMATVISSWQDRKLPLKDSEAQHALVCKALSEHHEVGKWFKNLGDHKSLRVAILVKGNDDPLVERNHPTNCNTHFQLCVHWLWPIELEMLKKIVLNEKPDVFQEWLNDLEYWIKSLS